MCRTVRTGVGTDNCPETVSKRSMCGSVYSRVSKGRGKDCMLLSGFRSSIVFRCRVAVRSRSFGLKVLAVQAPRNIFRASFSTRWYKVEGL